MPIMDVCEEDGSFADFSKEIVLSTMAYPREEEESEALVASLLADWISKADRHELLEDEFQQEMAMESAKILLHCLPKAQLLKKANARAEKGLRAGKLLLQIIPLATHHTDLDLGPTAVVKCIESYLREMAPARVKGLASSESTLWESWSLFKRVSHLYGAWVIYVDAWVALKPLEIINRGDFVDLDRFLKWKELRPRFFLSVAEDLRELAESLGILPVGECWRTPDQFRRMETQLTVPQLPEDILDYYRSYKVQ